MLHPSYGKASLRVIRHLRKDSDIVRFASSMAHSIEAVETIEMVNTLGAF